MNKCLKPLSKARVRVCARLFMSANFLEEPACIRFSSILKKLRRYKKNGQYTDIIACAFNEAFESKDQLLSFISNLRNSGTLLDIQMSCDENDEFMLNEIIVSSIQNSCSPSPDACFTFKSMVSLALFVDIIYHQRHQWAWAFLLDQQTVLDNYPRPTPQKQNFCLWPCYVATELYIEHTVSPNDTVSASIARRMHKKNNYIRHVLTEIEKRMVAWIMQNKTTTNNMFWQQFTFMDNAQK